MKYPITHVILTGLLVFALADCNKQDSKGSNPTKATLTLSQPIVKRGQQLTITVQNLSSTAGVKWSVSPSQGTQLIAARNQVTATFANAGQYVVTADLYADSSAPTPYDSSSTPVTVSDTLNAPPPVDSVDTSYYNVPVDSILITPVTTAHADTPCIGVYFTSLASYRCRPFMNYVFTQQGNTLTISDVYAMSNSSLGCNMTQTVGSGWFLSQLLPNGVYSFNVILSTKTYNGTLTVTDQFYTFNWPYTSGVIISPLQVPTQ